MHCPRPGRVCGWSDRRGPRFVQRVEAFVVARDACAWPVLTRLSADRLGVAYFNRPSHGLEEGDITARVSTDQGRTWREAGVAAPHPPGGNRMHLAGGVAHDGSWIVLTTGFSIVGGAHGRLESLWVSRCRPGEEMWSVRREVRVDGAAENIIPHGRILALPDGRLAMTCYRSWGRGRPSRSWIAFSADGGATWGNAHEFGHGDSNEACLLQLDDGTFLAATRTHRDHHVALHASPDGGRTWTQRCDLTLPMQHPADLAHLGGDDVLLTYGIRNRGLMGIGLRLSRDRGQTWGAPAVLYQFGEASDCGYPSTVSLGAGAMLTACYSDHSALYDGYHLLMIRWNLAEMFEPRALRSLSDGGPLHA